MTPENILPVSFGWWPDLGLVMKNKAIVVKIGEGRVKSKNVHRKRKWNLKIQWLDVGDSRKSQKQFWGRDL